MKKILLIINKPTVLKKNTVITANKPSVSKKNNTVVTDNKSTVLKKDNIIIIGNGPSVLKHEFGDIIDNFDEVVRINHYVPTKNVGKKLTIFAHSTYKTKIYNDVNLLAKEILVCNQINVKKFISYDKIKNTIINIKPIEDQLKKKHNFNTWPKSPWCSTGIVIIMYLMNKYDKICIYGFDYLKKSEQLHYFEKNITTYSPHSSDLERNFFEHYLKLGKLYKLEDVASSIKKI